jgi:hypothetical protein
MKSQPAPQVAPLKKPAAKKAPVVKTTLRAGLVYALAN